MRNILLTVSYDGTDFCGWQRQDKSDKGKSVRTVQAEIENALSKLHGTSVSIQGSGRTDSGVHARAQAANFLSPVDSFPVENYPRAVNAILPPDIRITGSRVVPEGFSSRFNAVSRTYRYFISYDAPVEAAQSRFVWNVRHKPDIDRLNEMASCLSGEIDCATFTAAGDASLSTCRYLEKACFFLQPDIFGNSLLVFEIKANAFLWKMVRSITGSLIEFDRSGKDTGYFRTVLEACDRRMAGPTAPPSGLFLWEIDFNGKRRHV